MNAASKGIVRIYLLLLLFNTLAASLIWGVNTLFLLDAGLSNFEAFAANAFFTAGIMVFEIPVGVIADLRGRRLSFLLGTLTLSVSTILYLLLWQVHAPFLAWAAVSAMLGFGFSFFSGAVEAWLVDALRFSGYWGPLEKVFAKGQVVTGAAMLVGSVAGGFIAQITSLGVPYILRGLILAASFVLAFFLMRDLGFVPAKRQGFVKETADILSSSLSLSLRSRPMRWIMLGAPFTAGVGIYGFYALQPYLLELWGNEEAYGIAGLAAAILAGAQILGGLAEPYLARIFRRRTTFLLISAVIGALLILFTGIWSQFWPVIILVILFGLISAASMPARQAYINSLLPSSQRATILSFDALLGSSGGVVVQPILGRVADVWSYPASYVAAGAIYAFAIPCAWLARRSADKKADSGEV